MSATSPTDSNAQKFEADLVIVNANVHTMEEKHPTAEAVAVFANRIAAVGSNEEIKSLTGARTRVVDAHGALVLPGFNDAHVHFLSGGFQLSSVDLRDANSPQEFAERIRRFAERLPAGRWITGGDWDHERWAVGGGKAPLPTKELIDSFTPDRAVFVNRLDGHMALANSYALKLAGITRDTPDPPGGIIVRDPKTGEPTGVLKDAAQDAVWKVAPDPTLDENSKPRAPRPATPPRTA
jgi:predicted amidohydrolase YtcJ